MTLYAETHKGKENRKTTKKLETVLKINKSVKQHWHTCNIGDGKMGGSGNEIIFID
jgi:hypothetical protein